VTHSDRRASSPSLNGRSLPTARDRDGATAPARSASERGAAGSVGRLAESVLGLGLVGNPDVRRGLERLAAIEVCAGKRDSRSSRMESVGTLLQRMATEGHGCGCGRVRSARSALLVQGSRAEQAQPRDAFSCACRWCGGSQSAPCVAGLVQLAWSGPDRTLRPA
jgi:hypothetical protein